MRRRILSSTDFRGPSPGWQMPPEADADWQTGADGLLLSPPPGKQVHIDGFGVHTRNGDTVELHFRVRRQRGGLTFGFSGGFESAVVSLDFEKGRASLSTTDWTRPQPVGSAPFKLARNATHVLLIEKTEAGGTLVKNADVRVSLDGRQILSVFDLNLLPELGVTLRVGGTRVLVKRFVQRGTPSGEPEHLHVGGWQMLNRDSIADNLTSLRRGLREAVEQGVQLLVTPETSLTGLFPTHRVTKNHEAVAQAEAKLRKSIRGLKGAPYVVVGLPVWDRIPGHRMKRTRYNVSRVYDPDGYVVSTHAKIHSCEAEFWHGYRLHEFDVYGTPVCMHICHDGRYPEVWTLPVMFGARLILHPCNGGTVTGSIDAFEAKAKSSTVTSHAFYVRVNGGGGSYIAGPGKFDDLIDVSAECRRDARSFPAIDDPQECLVHANLRLHDAYGYWPVRSFRASEEVAEAYRSLYQAMGGQRSPDEDA